MFGFVVGLLASSALSVAALGFTDVTSQAGLTFPHDEPGLAFRGAIELGGGVAAGDYDGDGWVDLYVVGGEIGTNRLFHNNGDGTFEDRAAAAGVALAGVRSCGPLFFDFDGDGDLDLFVGGVDGTPLSLFRNEGDGTFVDVTAASGLVVPVFTFGASAGDYDHDGDLDLFLTHWSGNLATTQGQVSSFHLWRNDGSGTFTDVTSDAGIVALGPSDGFNGFTANFSDIDGDGWADLLLTGDFGTSRIYRNLRNGTFAYATDPAVITDGNGMGAAVGDYDEDGDLDWFVSSIWDPNGISEGYWDTSGNRLYRNKGNGTFEDATDVAGVRQGYWGWGSTFQDFDNDGHLDLFHVNGYGLPALPETSEFLADPARLFMGNGNGTFTERAAALGIADTGQGRGIVAFDYDHDGDLDLYINNHLGPSRLYRNDGGNAQRWLEVKLTGREPNTEAIGAWIRVITPGATQLRELRAGSNYVSQDPAIGHFGLGQNRTVTIEVAWPDGARSVLERVSSNQRLTLVQPPPGVDEQTKAQRNCIIGLNVAGAKVAGAVATRLVRCVQAGVKRTLPIGTTAETCLAGDGDGRIAAAAAKTDVVGTRDCSVSPTFGPFSSAAVNTAMTALLRPHDLFGPDVDAVLADAHAAPAVAACQQAVAKGVATVALAKLKAFNACKVSGVRRNTLRSAADLVACADAETGPSVAKVVVRVQKKIAKRCADVDLATALPGRCGAGALEDLGTCLDEQARCGVCRALGSADRMSTFCHRFEDGVATGYCADRPATTRSIARQWDEILLDAIRRDTPRPTVHARNLFHLSAVMWDAWRAYGGGGSAWLTDESHTTADPDAARLVAISFAAYRLLAERFQTGPGAVATASALRAKMEELGLDVAYTTTVGDAPAAVGNRIGAAMIAFGLTDGSNEAGNYADATYVPLNAPLIVKQPGIELANPNHWQPLALDLIVTQNGITVPDKVQSYIGARWNQVAPFALTRANPSDVYIDPGPPPQLFGAGDAAYKESARRLVELSSQLTPDDGATIDISPGAYGNNPLGTNDGTGRPLNPVTGAPYAPNVVPRGDFGRVMAEFWADGPNSETPPGHWNVLANEVSDHPLCTHQWGGSGPALDRLEWDVKTYFALNGAVHDAAITAWGLKRKYDSVRPISMIRYLGSRGQSSNPAGPSYDVGGLPLQPGLIEVITAATTAPGQRHAHLAGHEGEIAVLSWPGAPGAPASDHSGVRWVRAVEWIPYQKKTFVSPAFPGFTSGHSTFSRAAAEVLTRVTGSPFFPGGLGHFTAVNHQYLTFEDGPSVDVSLQWSTYYDAADQAGQSRLWGGIHVTADDFIGRITGAQVGAGAFDRAAAYFAGTVGP